MDTKRRSNRIKYTAEKWETPTAGGNSVRNRSTQGLVDIAESQITETEDHAWPPRKGKFKRDIGGEFFSERTYIENKSIQNVKLRGPNNIGPTGQPKWTRWWQGAVFPRPAEGLMYPTSGRMSDSDMDEYGATAVARCKPTNSAIDVGQMLGELFREGLPRFGPSSNWRERIAAAKAAGDDYLNYQFGWKPLVSDFSNFLENIDSSYAALEQLRKDNKKLVRRRYSFPDELSETSTEYGPGDIILTLNDPDYVIRANGKIIMREESRRKIWFSGAFRYHLPASLKGESELAELRALAEHSLGLTLSPELLWELTPWSWAVDWFTNTGDIISNITDSQKYGLIMPYGYVMVNTIKKRTFTPIGMYFTNSVGTPSPISFITETKQRRRANPFGFGVSDGDLDLTQISILAALGLSRSR